MRLPSYVLLAFLIGTSACVGGTAALANVLLPEDNKSDSDQDSYLPNLGLGKFFGLKSKKDTPAPTGTLPTAQPNQNQLAVPAQPSTADNAGAGQSFKQLLTQIEARQLQSKIRAPLFLSDNDIVQDPESAADLPETFTVVLNSAYFWGPEDIKTITKAFGYDIKGIQQHCIVRLGVRVITNNNDYRSVVYPGQQTMIRFEGTVQNVDMLARAVCDKPAEIPQFGSTIQIVKDKLAVKLSKNLTCIVPANATAPTYLETAYNGDGSGPCKFR